MTEWDLRSLPYEDLLQMFYRLPAPAGLDGEYMAMTLDSGNLAANIFTHLGFTPIFPGQWIGKAFVGGEGYGYNSFLWFGKMSRR